MIAFTMLASVFSVLYILFPESWPLWTKPLFFFSYNACLIFAQYTWVKYKGTISELKSSNEELRKKVDELHKKFKSTIDR